MSGPTVVPGQLELFADVALLAAGAIATPKPRFAKQVPAGAARLMRELVKRGLDERAYLNAAALVLVLDGEEAP